MVFVYVSTHVSEFPINTILAWIIENYHEQGNIIITNLLLPLGHISNTNLWWWRIKATDYIIKVSITRGNATWRSFALRGWAYKQISTWQPLLPSVKGLSFTFMQESKYFPLFLFIFLFGRHHVVGKYLGTYTQLDMSEHELLLLTSPLRWIS